MKIGTVFLEESTKVSSLGLLRIIFPFYLKGEGEGLQALAPFRFGIMWIKEEGFKDLIREWWQSFEFRGTSSYVLMEKIKALKSKLKVWNKEVFGRVEENKKKALSKVAAWDDLENQRSLSLAEAKARLVAMEDFKKWSIMEETSWRQKSREIWLKGGGGGGGEETGLERF